MRCETRSAKTEVAKGRSVDRLDVEDGVPNGINRSSKLERWQVGPRRFENGCFSGLTYTSSSTG